jgi:LacI family transcriptional regulator
LEQHPQITALFACNDHTAIAALRAAQAIGRRVPEDLAVIGFDDIDLAQHVVPALTTMHVDKVTMGRLAVQMLKYRLAHPESDQVTTVLRPRLVERESVTSRPTGAS